MQKGLHFLLFIILLGFNIPKANALPAPEITCITTEANGDLTINWIPITDPNGDFDSYELFGVSGGSYGTISNINTNSQTFTSIGVGNIDGYFITTNSGPNGNTVLSSDTLQNIYLDLNNPGNGAAILQWNKPFPTQIGLFNDYFHIYKEFPAGTWTLIDSVVYNTTNYSDTISICEEFINYQIVLPTINCDFTSNIEGDIFVDKIVPNIPVISNVNIDTLTNDITVSWDVNGQTDTYGYVVYQTDLNGNLVEIDTVWGRPNTNFTHSENLENGPFQYSIAAFDSCYTTNVPPTFQTSAKAEPHTTNQLSSTIDACNRLLNLSWTGYLGFDSLDLHKIFIKTNGGTWQEVGQSATNSFSTNINLGDEMIVAIQTISYLGVASFSNKDTVTLVGGTGNGISYLGVATVDGDNIEVKQRVSTGEAAKIIELERFNPDLLSFEKIDETAIGISNEIIFTDSEVEVNRRSYTYRTNTIDTCNQVASVSNIGKSIFLNVITKSETEMHTLQWTAYEEFIGGISRYKIYRSIDGFFNATPIAVSPYNKRTYTDDVSEHGESSEGKICYYIEAVEASNEYGVQEASFSNIACGVIEPVIYIPNAFSVGGKNPIFKPETRQRQIDYYLFEIYDRYGRVIFSTTNPAEGWNGQLREQSIYANEGIYIYRLSLRDGNGIEVIRHGHVTLLDYRELK
jgi:gliding motility-associated-like protein